MKVYFGGLYTCTYFEALCTFIICLVFIGNAMRALIG